MANKTSTLKGFNYKNITSDSLKDLLVDSFRKNINKQIVPGENYIPVTGKVLDEEDVLMGIEAMMDAWLTAGRFSEQFEKE
ncbi:MAG TPA: hypothetical protein VF700_10525, partial [Segetibacter sp.]